MLSRLTQDTHYELFPHQADIGVRGVGCTEEAAFEQAALALTSIALAPEIIPDRERVFIHCQAPNHALLLADWLNALIYEAGTRKMVFGRFQVHLSNHQLDGVAWGDKLHERYELTVEAKGATYTELLVEKQADGLWIAQCVIDV